MAGQLSPVVEPVMIRDLIRHDLILRLYQGAGSIKRPPDDQNYRPRPLKPELWEEERGVFTYPKVTFKFSGPAGMVTGYQLTLDSLVIADESFPIPGFMVEDDGDTISVVPRIVPSDHIS